MQPARNTPTHRPILPATPSQYTPQPPRPSPSIPKRRRLTGGIACQRCRLKKVSCDAQKPSCTRCATDDTPCDYTPHSPSQVAQKQLDRLRRDLATYRTAFAYLRSAPGEDAASAVRRLRAAPSAVASARWMALLGQPSSVATARGVSPPTASAAEFELSVVCGRMYPSLEPLALSGGDLECLFGGISDMTGVDAVIASGQGSRGERPKLSPPEASSSGVLSDASSSLSLGRQYCDERLYHLTDLGFWTKVPVTDDFAAGAISKYLETDHAIWGFFDADLFLSDLVDHRLEYCSPFLFSSLLFLACLCYTASDGRASLFSHAFKREATRLLPAYRPSDSFNTVAAMAVLSLACTWYGDNELGLGLLAEGRAMAERLHLMGVPGTHPGVANLAFLSGERRRGVAHVAWGCYSYVTIHVAFHRGKHIPYPPCLPIPGCPDDHGLDGTSRNSTEPLSPPPFMGHTFIATCQLWTILQEVLGVYHQPNETPLPQRVILAFAEEKYQKLLRLGTMLTDDLGRDGSNPLHVYIFHTLYHISVMDLFRPFLSHPSPVQTLSSADSSPNTIFHASLRQLQRLIITYMRRSLFRRYTSLLNPAIMHLSSMALARPAPIPDWRFYFAVCAHYWLDAAPGYPIIADVAGGYLSMAISSGSLTPGEARAWRERIEGRRAAGGEKGTVTEVVVDFQGAMEGEGRASELAGRFEELAIFNELVDAD